MANHTAAERERIAKRRKREKLLIEAFCFVAIAIFIVLSSRRNAKLAAQEAEALAAPTVDPYLDDQRVIYIRRFSSEGYLVANDAVRLSLTESDGSAVQLIAYESGGALCVKYRFAFKCRESSSGSALFPSIDLSTEEPAPELSSYAENAVRYLAPLLGDSSSAAVIAKLEDALLTLYDDPSGKCAFVIGVYSVNVVYSSAEGMVTVTALPSA